MNLAEKIGRIGATAVVCLGVIGLLGGCVDSTSEDSDASAGPSGYPYKIVATTGMVADVVREVAGERAKVEQLMGAAVDPHLYAPTATDMKALSEADVIVYSGLHLEGKMGDTLVQLARSGKPVYALTELLPKEMLIYADEESATPDPHVWMDVSAWSKGVDVVVKALSDYDKANAAEYAKNAEAYKAKLAELHKYVTTVVASIPEQQRVMITAHDAFQYFGQAYNIEVRGLQGISTESEAGVADVNDLVDFVVKRNIGAIFVESTISDQNMKALLEGARSRGHAIEIGGELFSDAMGAAGTYEGTYIGMLDHNATIIARSLGGEAPEKGMQGKLTGEH